MWSIIRAMKRTDPQFKIRLPDELKERLEVEAEKAGRSVTAEIVFRLYESFRTTPAEDARQIAAAYKAVGGIQDTKTSQEEDLLNRIDSRIRYLEAITERLATLNGTSVEQDAELAILKKAAES